MRMRSHRKRTARVLRFRLLRSLTYACGLIVVGALLVGTLLASGGGSVTASHGPPVMPTPSSTAAGPINLVISDSEAGETIAHLCQEVLVAEVTVDHLGTGHWNSHD